MTHDVHDLPEVAPAWMQAYKLGEGDFEAAYYESRAEERAWIKRAIATHHLWLGAETRESEFIRTALSPGIRCTVHRRPRNWAAVHVPAPACAPGTVLAATLPILMAGVWPVMVVLESGCPAQSAVIMSLELAGIDCAYVLPPDTMEHALAHWVQQSRSDPGMVVVIADDMPIARATQMGTTAQGHLLLGLPRPKRGAVWAQEQNFDMRALSFAHPGVEMTLWGAEGEAEMPLGWRLMHGTWEEFVRQPADVVWVPQDRLVEAVGAFDLALGPGQEPVWIWPWYVPGLAWISSLGLD